MADDKNENEKTVTDGAEREASTVKKKTVKKRAVKKKVANKKVAKKKVVSKKAATTKESAPKASVAAGATKTDEMSTLPPTTSAVEPGRIEPKQATPTHVAAAAATSAGSGETKVAAKTADSSSAHKTASSNVIVQTQFKKTEPAEETSMPTDTKSAGSFWVKVIFWLIIIVLAFVYIRSLAKHPDGSEAVTEHTAAPAIQSTVDESPAQASTATIEAAMQAEQEAAMQAAEQEAAMQAAEQEAVMPAEPAPEASTQATTESGATASADDSQLSTASDAAATESTSEALTATIEPDTSAPTDEASTTETDAVGMSGVQAALNEAKQVEDQAQPEAGAQRGEAGRAAADRTEAMRDVHDESVSKVLKEFDDLRNAARAEMEAKRRLMQAERELRDAMAPPRRPVYPPSWRGPAYNPYDPTQQYPRY
jgi:hypothetical protein